MNKNLYVDALAEVKKSPNYKRYSKDVDARIRFASEVFNTRKSKDISQTELAKKVYTTQKVISKIESGDTNTGLELINRIVEELEFNSENLCRAFNCSMVISINYKAEGSAVSNELAEVVSSANGFCYLTTNLITN